MQIRTTCLEKDVAAVKNDIAALTDQITDALNAFAGSAGKQARRGYKQARADAEFRVRRHVRARQRHDGRRPGRGLFARGDRWKTPSRSVRWRPSALRSASAF